MIVDLEGTQVLKSTAFRTLVVKSVLHVDNIGLVPPDVG